MSLVGMCVYVLTFQAKLLAIELHKWIGPALKASIDGKIKPVQVSLLAKNGDEKLWARNTELAHRLSAGEGRDKHARSSSPLQMKELEEEFEKHSGGPPAPTRLLRSQQQVAAVVEVVSAGGDSGGEKERASNCAINLPLLLSW